MTPDNDVGQSRRCLLARAANTISERSNVAEHGIDETRQGLASGIEVPRQAIDQRRGDNRRVGDAGDFGGLFGGLDAEPNHDRQIGEAPQPGASLGFLGDVGRVIVDAKFRRAGNPTERNPV